MADFTIDPIAAGADTGAITFELNLVKVDGSPGEVEAPPSFLLEPPGMGEVVAMPHVANSGTYAMELRHNGSVGEATLTVGQTDGDLLAGPDHVHPIGPFSKTVMFTAGLGAASAVFNGGAQHAPTS